MKSSSSWLFWGFGGERSVRGLNLGDEVNGRSEESPEIAVLVGLFIWLFCKEECTSISGELCPKCGCSFGLKKLEVSIVAFMLFGFASERSGSENF